MHENEARQQLNDFMVEIHYACLSWRPSGTCRNKTWPSACNHAVMRRCSRTGECESVRALPDGSLSRLPREALTHSAVVELGSGLFSVGDVVLTFLIFPPVSIFRLRVGLAFSRLFAATYGTSDTVDPLSS